MKGNYTMKGESCYSTIFFSSCPERARASCATIAAYMPDLPRQTHGGAPTADSQGARVQGDMLR